MILVDSNVLIDVFDRDPQWFDWSSAQLKAGRDLDQLGASQIVVVEIGPRFVDLKQCEAALDDFSIASVPFTNRGAFEAGLAFREFRSRRESKTSVLADFLIGGQAIAIGASILTRDPRFFRTYFSDVPLITPDKDFQ